MKTTLTAAVLLVVHMAGAQSAKAYEAFAANDHLKARDFIEQAVANGETEDAKVWYYRGMIYENILINPNLKIDDASIDPVKEMARSYSKALTLNTDNIDRKNLQKRYQKVSNRVFMSGIQLYNNGDYQAALEMYQMAADVGAYFGKPDSLAIFNIALCQEKLGKTDEAISAYKKAADLNYKSAQAYSAIIYLLQSSERRTEALAMATQAKEKHPADQSILVSYLNLLLYNGRHEEAVSVLSKLIEIDASNANFFYTRGTIYDGQDKTELARMDYEAAIRLNPDFFEPHYNLGASYLNESAGMIDLMSEVSGQEKYQEYKERINGVFNTSIKYLERALELKPDDRYTLEALNQLYANTNQTEKYLEVKKKLGQ